jgi:hypothetical protein
MIENITDKMMIKNGNSIYANGRNSGPILFRKIASIAFWAKVKLTIANLNVALYFPA